MAVWAKYKPRGGDSNLRILRMLIRPPANLSFLQSFAYFWAILCEPYSQKSRFFSGTTKFSCLYTGDSRVPPRALAIWAKTLRGQIWYITCDSVPLNLDLLNGGKSQGRKKDTNMFTGEDAWIASRTNRKGVQESSVTHMWVEPSLAKTKYNYIWTF